MRNPLIRLVTLYVALITTGLALSLHWWLAASIGPMLAAGVAYQLRRLARGIDHSETSRRSNWLASAQLGIGWGVALAVSGYSFHAHYGRGPQVAFSEALNGFLLVTTAIGGLYAVFRSVATQVRSEATHDHVAAMRTQLDGHRTRLAELALETYSTSTPEEVIQRLMDMLNVAVRSLHASPHVDSMSLWASNGSQWFIIVATDMDSTDSPFCQPIIDKVTPGAGVVANMAATGQIYFLQNQEVSKHPWWRPSHSGEPTEAMGAVLLRNPSGTPIGALCLTSKNQGELHQHALENALRWWGVSFTLGLESLSRHRREHA